MWREGRAQQHFSYIMKLTQCALPLTFAFVFPFKRSFLLHRLSFPSALPRPAVFFTQKEMAQQPAHYNADNVFAKILDGSLPSHKIFETDSCIAILDAFPAVTGHALLISKAPASTIMDLTEQQAADVLKELPRLCRAVQKATGSDGVNVLHNGGASAGQVVFHLHVHVVPRFAGDGLFSQFKSSKTMITPEEASNVLAKIKAHL